MIVEQVTKQLNSKYDEYLLRNPQFNGRVSILAHSLGSVICYNILSHQISRAQKLQCCHFPHKQPNCHNLHHYQHLQQLKKSLPQPQQTTQGLQEPQQKQERQDNQSNMDQCNMLQQGGQTNQSDEYPQLKFAVHNMFAVGSPMGMFFTVMHEDDEIKRQSGKVDQRDRLPQCNNLYNIFHLHDPIAYRFETWLNNTQYADLNPVPISPFKTYFQNNNASEENQPATYEIGKLMEGSNSCTKPRFDYLMPSSSGVMGEYANVPTAHRSYWKSKDLMMFILDKLQSN